MDQPEKRIRDAIKRKLTARGWHVIITHGNQFQSGLPDLYCFHESFPPRWIEVKLPNMVGSRFTSAQLEVFPKMLKCHVGIYILTGDSDTELDKLTGRPNIELYLLQEITGVKMVHRKKL